MKTTLTKTVVKIGGAMIILLIVVVIIGVIVVNVSPKPTSLFVRKLFENPQYKKQDNFEEIKNKVSIKKDLEYPSKHKLNTFNYYSLKDNSSNLPTIIWVHGGAFVGGDKENIDQYAITLAAQGYNVLSMNYLRAPEAAYPTPVTQLTEFSKYLQNNAQEYRIDFNNLYYAGDSAGASIVSQFALIQTNKKYESSMGIASIMKSKDIKGLLLYCGPYDMRTFHKEKNTFLNFMYSQIAWAYTKDKNWKNNKELLEQFVIYDHLTKDFPRSYVTDGNKNSFESNGKELVSQLKKQNVKVQGRFFETGVSQHEFQFSLETKEAQIVLEDTLAFLQ